MKAFYYISFCYCIFIFSGCNIDKWDLENQSNKLISNYSLTLNTIECKESFNTNIFPLDKNSFVTAIEGVDRSIKIIKISQKINGNAWGIVPEIKISQSGDDLIGFEKSGKYYYLTSASNGKTSVTKIDSSFNTLSSFSSFEQYVDTSYNDITTVAFQKMVVDTSDGIYLIGQLSSFTKNYSCVIKLNKDLKPIYLKTYFENDTIQSLLPLDNDRFIALNQRLSELSLISDNSDGKQYKKYNLTFNEIFNSANLIQSNGKLYLTGVVGSGTGKTIEVSLDKKNAFISDVKNYEVTGMSSYGISRNSLLLSGVTKKGSENFGFLAEYKNKEFLWCKTYNDQKYLKSVAINEALDVGLIYLFIVENNGRYFIHVLKTDEEGATLEYPYSSNCL